MAKHDIEIRRFLAWRKKVRGKTSSIRMCEVIFVGVTMLWSKMGKPPLKTAIYMFIERNEYQEQLISGQLFQEVIDKIIANPNDDGSGYYLSDSKEIMSHKDIKQLKKEMVDIIKDLSTNNTVERYEAVFRTCERYEAWALNKKSQESEDITKQESFETWPTLPLAISSNRT